MNRTLPRLALLLLAGLVPGVHALPEDRDQPIRISADSAEIDDATGTATYIGDVRLDQGTLRVTAATLIIETEDESVTRITARGAADGEPARYQQLPAENEEPVLANAATIIYRTTEERIEMEGDARLRQDEDRFEGDRIVYDLRARTVAATSTREDGRVNFTIRPDRLPGGRLAPDTAPEPAPEPASGAASGPASDPGSGAEIDPVPDENTAPSGSAAPDSN